MPSTASYVEGSVLCLSQDKDVARLQDFQELELVLVRSDSSPFRNAAPALTERSCYNSRASKLTY